MDFRFADEQLAFRGAVRAFCEQHFALATCADREGLPADAATWRALADMGVFGLLVQTGAGKPGDAGEFGPGVVDAAVAFEPLGAHLASGPLLWSTITAPLVPGVDTGAVRVTGIDVVASPRPPFVIEHVAESDTVVVIRPDGVAAVPVAELPSALPGEPLDPLTPTLAYPDLPLGDAIAGADTALRLRLIGTVLAAAQLVGSAQGALDVARAYALERRQFGVPIGSFQAVKHLLADMYVRVDLARSATYAAAAVLDDAGAGHAAVAASTAKLLAGDAGIANARSAVQVLGGMGFTWQMAPHYFLKRAWVLEESFGTGDAHALALSAALEHAIRDPAATWT